MKRTFAQRSERVKGVEFHPTEPWLLTNMYNGSVVVYNYQDQSVVKSFEVSELPGELPERGFSILRRPLYMSPPVSLGFGAPSSPPGRPGALELPPPTSAR